MSSAILYVVATPIGNLEDISLRALSVLDEVDVIAAEDTRRTRTLLARHGLRTPMISVHEHNEEQMAPLLLERLKKNESVALVSDAGTPLLSDPGYRLVRLAARANIRIVPIPGPSAITAALSVSGLATDRFLFEGFLPPKKTARIKLLESLRHQPRTFVLFESAHRIIESLRDISDVIGADRQAAICREMTKQFETVLRGSLAELRLAVSSDPDQQKGEFVIVVAGAEEKRSRGFDEALELAIALQEYLSASQAARVAARISGVPRRQLYEAIEQHN